MRAPGGQLAVAAGVVAIGALILGGSFFLPTGGGYAQVGPGVVPRIVGVGTIILGIALLREALTGGFRGVDEAAEEHLPMHWGYFAWASGGIIAYGLTVEWLGFIIASTVLFVAVARAFASTRWLLNAVTGVVLAAAVFAIFNYGLGLALATGAIFSRLLSARPVPRHPGPAGGRVLGRAVDAEPDVVPGRRRARHRGGCAAGRGSRRHGGAAAADHDEGRCERRPHHVRRHLLRRDVR